MFLQISSSVFNLALEHIQCVTGLLRTKEDDHLEINMSGNYDLNSAAVFLLKKVTQQRNFKIYQYILAILYSIFFLSPVTFKQDSSDMMSQWGEGRVIVPLSDQGRYIK